MSRQVPRQQRWETVNFASGLLNPLQNHAAGYAPAEDLLVVVGGRSASDTEAPSSRWHAIDLDASRVSAYTAAERVYGASVALDPAFPRMLAFGGRTTTGRPSNNLWQLDLTNGFDSSAFALVPIRYEKPPARYDHAAAFDAAHGRLVVYGGATGHQQPLGESCTWVFDARANTWERLEGAWVGERIGAVMVYDSHHGTVILAGGTGRAGREASGAIHYLDCPLPATATSTPTATVVPPSRTPTATATEVVASPTPTATACPTDRGVTPTPSSPAATPTGVASSTAGRTFTPGPTPRATEPTPVTTSTPPPPRCILPLVCRRQ